MTPKKEDVEKYLQEVKMLVSNKKYKISVRDKNDNLLLDYVLGKNKREEIIQSLTADDFCGRVKNTKPGYEYELLYIFGKSVRLISRFGDSEENVSLYIKFNKIGNDYVVVISFHPEEKPLRYVYKKGEGG